MRGLRRVTAFSSAFNLHLKVEAGEEDDKQKETSNEGARPPICPVAKMADSGFDDERCPNGSVARTITLVPPSVIEFSDLVLSDLVQKLSRKWTSRNHK